MARNCSENSISTVQEGLGSEIQKFMFINSENNESIAAMFAEMKRRLKGKRSDESMSQSIKGAGAESGFRTTDSIAGLICRLAEREPHHPS